MMKKILFIIQLPPPVHGMSLMNQFTYENDLLDKEFNKEVFDLSLSTKNDELGKLTFSKIIKYSILFFRLFTTLLFSKYHTVYFTPTPYGKVFYRDIFILFLIKITGHNMTLHWHGIGLDKYKTRKIFNTILKWLLKNAQMICLGQNVTSDLKGFSDENNITVIPNGVEFQERLEVEKKYDFLFFSNIKKAKGIYTFLDALSILKNKGVLFKAAIAGSETKELSIKNVRALIEKYDLSGEIVYLGKQYGNDKQQLFSKSRIFVFPTQFEAFGLVAIEAMAYGLPIIASKEGSLTEIIEEENGFVIDKTEVKLFAEKMEFLIKRPNLCKTYEKNNIHKFKKLFTKEMYQTNIVNFFKSINI